jgi:hypothetical protein
LTEKRYTEWSHEPHHWGSFVDGPENGPQPDPWSFEIPRPALKKPEDEKSEDKVEWEGNGKEKRKIPHTEHVMVSLRSQFQSIESQFSFVFIVTGEEESDARIATVVENPE